MLPANSRLRPAKTFPRFSLPTSLYAATMLACACLGLSNSSAQQVQRQTFSPDAESRFERGRIAYGSGELERALRLFEEIGGLPANQRSTAALFLMGKTLVRLGQHREALAAVRRLQRDYPGSRYSADARLVAGDCYYELRRYYEAATEYARLLAAPAALALQASAAERLAGIVKNRVITQEAQVRIMGQVGEQRFRDAILFGEARWYARLGWEQRSREAMGIYLETVPNGVFAPLADRTLAAAGTSEAQNASHTAKVRDQMDVAPSPRTDRDGSHAGAQVVAPNLARDLAGGPGLGILMPLSGPQGYVGEELLAGIRMANDELGEPFELIAIDTGERRVVGTGSDYSSASIPQSEGSRLMRTIWGAQSLAREQGIKAIIGPVFSSSCVAASAVAEAAGVPLIAPLAQQSGLDSLGRHIFQLRAVPEVQGRALAEYATLVLGLETLVVLAPLTEYGWSFQRAFSAAAHVNGGRVVHSDWYVHEETTDFHSQFDAIRQVGFKLIAPQPATDSLAVFDSLSVAVIDTTAEGNGTFFELLEGAPDSLVVSEEPDSSEIFIDTIDGIAVVVESFADAGRIAPQLRFARLQTQVLGNDIWYQPEHIRQMSPIEREHMKGAIFVSGRHGSSSSRDFTDEFRRRFGRDPGFAAYGYDAVHILTQGWEAGHRSRQELRDWLAQLQGYEGAAGRVSFASGRRANTELSLLKIDSTGRVLDVTDGDLPELLLPQDDLPTADAVGDTMEY